MVIGAGLGGLAAALHLAGTGRCVTVLEEADEPGGLAGVLRERGYTFDTGPTVLTLPQIVEDVLAAVGEPLDGWLTLRRLDPAYRARFADGSTLDVHADVDAMADQIGATCGPGDAEGYRRFVAFLRELYRVEMANFIDRNLDSPLALLGAPGLRLLRLGAFGRLARKVASFMADERLRRLFTFQSLYVGVPPSRALAVYAVIAYLDCVAGVYVPAGGMRALPCALAAAAEKHGVEFRYGTRAARLEVVGGRARAVITAGGERIPADVVVSSSGTPLDGQPRSCRAPRYSPSCVLLHAGSTAAYPHLAHHTISFGRAWEATFEEIDRGSVMSDPSFLLTTPTLSDPSLAPPGRHAYYALFPAPNLVSSRVDWRAERDRYRDRILATLEGRGLAGFADGLEVSHLVTPADWLARGLPAGTPFGAAHTFWQTGPFRPSTLSRRVENLLFCGANVQPGVGVPMALLSGRLAAQRVTGRAHPGSREIVERQRSDLTG